MTDKWMRFGRRPAPWVFQKVASARTEVANVLARATIAATVAGRTF